MLLSFPLIFHCPAECTSVRLQTDGSSCSYWATSSDLSPQSDRLQCKYLRWGHLVLSFSFLPLLPPFSNQPQLAWWWHTSADWLDRRIKLQADWWAMLERLLACAGACIFHPWLKAYVPYNRDSVRVWVSGSFLHIWQGLALFPGESAPRSEGGSQPCGICRVAGSVWIHWRAIFISACFPNFVKDLGAAFRVTWLNLPKREGKTLTDFFLSFF